MNLIDNWKEYHKRWSVWLVTFGTTMLGFADQLPQLLVNAWTFVPTDMKVAFEPSTVRYIGFACLIMSLIAGIIKQKSTQPK